MFGQENQRGDLRLLERRPQTHHHNCDDDAGERRTPEPARPVLQRALRLQDEPTGAEQRVAEHQRDAGHQRERGEAVERTAGEVAPVGLKALDESAEHHALREGAERGAVAERVVPKGAALGVAVAELERHAAVSVEAAKAARPLTT